MNQRNVFYPAIMAVILFSLAACQTPKEPSVPAPASSAEYQAIEPCSKQWNQQVELRLNSGDGQGHGPDIGSDEWRHVVEFKLGIRDREDVPATNSDSWCSFIDKLMTEQFDK